MNIFSKMVRILGAAGSLLPIAAHAEFIDDAQVSLGLRNFYIDRDFKSSGAPQSRQGSWTQGFDFQAVSGYTQGPLQFGLDLAVQYAFRLDGGGGRAPDTIIPYDHEKGEPVHDYGRAAMTAKVRFSKTELKLGEHRPRLPVVFMDDTRQLITTYHGALLESKEVDKLTLTAGRFTRTSTRESSDREKLYLFTGPQGVRRPSDGLNFAGLTYELTPKLSVSYFYAQLEDIYQQHYFGSTHTANLGGGYSLKTDLRYYDNDTDGKKLYGEIDNRAYSILSILRKNGHGFGIGYQRMLGETNFPTLNGYAPQPYLGNWSNIAFISPDEKSWQVRYDYDFAALGIPGLQFVTRYMRGTNIDRGEGLSESTESERQLRVAYTVQSGALKGLAFEWLNSDIKRRHAMDFEENRLITSWKWKF